MIIKQVIDSLDQFAQHEVKTFLKGTIFRELVVRMRTQYMQQLLTLNPNDEELVVKYRVLRHSLASWDEFEALIRQLDEEKKYDL